MKQLLKDTLDYYKKIIDIPSPVGYTHELMGMIEKDMEPYGYEISRTNKGALIITIKGEDDEHHKLLTAHIDTLGAVVKEVKENGRLRLTNVGGFSWGAFEGEHATIHTFTDKEYTGTLLPTKASVHIYGPDARTQEKTAENMEVRIDEKVASKEETLALGIGVGDYVSFDPRCRILDNGYIKSRFLDDKICVAMVMALIKASKENGYVYKNTTHFYITDFEEIGHGVSVVGDKVDEMIGIDIGIVGPDQLSKESSVTIVAKDSRTPYDYRLRKHLTKICEENNIEYITDVFNFYGSDASTSVLTGTDVRIACFGPGVDATHHYERCHIDGIKSTLELMYHYLIK